MGKCGPSRANFPNDQGLNRLSDMQKVRLAGTRYVPNGLPAQLLPSMFEWRVCVVNLSTYHNGLCLIANEYCMGTFFVVGTVNFVNKT